MGGYKFYLYLSYLSLFSIAAPICIGFLKRKSFSVQANILLGLIIISLFSEITIFILHKYHLSNLFI